MKATKKIVGAACALVAAVALSAGSTFAWFASNNTVTANGLEVNVKAESTYLLISREKITATTIQAEKGTSATFTYAPGASTVLPCKPFEKEDELRVGEGEIFSSAPGGAIVDSGADAAIEGNWYYANGTDEATGTAKVGSGKVLTQFDGYVITEKVYLTVAKGALPAHNLTVTPTFTKTNAGGTTTMSPVKVMIFTTIDSTEQNFIKFGSGISTAQNLHATTNSEITDTTVLIVDIYIYYDGSDTAVTTNNIANLSGATLTLEFGVEPKTT